VYRLQIGEGEGGIVVSGAAVIEMNNLTIEY
jgi:hypothetical protein